MLQPIRSDKPAENDNAALYALLVSDLRHAAVFLLDTEGRIASWNPGVEYLLGYGESEWVGQSGAIVFTPEDRASGEPEKELAAARTGGAAADVRWHLRKDDSPIFVDGVMQRLSSPDGTLLGYAKVMKDATERQVAQETLHSMVESISDAFYGLDSEFRFTYVNSKAEEWWGRSRESLVGRHYWTEFPSAKGSESYRMHLKCMAERNPLRYETISPIIGRWVDVSLYPDARGGLSCYFRNIEDRKRDEDRLRQLTEGLNLTQVIVRELDGTVQFWSEGSARLFGFTSDEALGRSVHELLQSEFPEPLEQLQARLLSSGRWHGESRHVCRNGSLVICESDWILHRGPSGEVRAVIEANTDITGQKKSQEQLQRANEELTQFSHIVSHDLQAPLRMVRSYAELLARRYQSQLDQTADEFLNFILQGARGMDTLIRTLLEYAQATDYPVRKQQVRVDTVLAAVLMALQPAIDESGAEIVYENLPTVEADPVQLQQVLQNLVGNALKYRKPDAKPRVHLHVEGRPHEWLFSVEDNGIGIDPRHKERIFEPLRRLHGPEIAGTGIGLAVCKRIVERHGGRIWVESQPGRGSAFRFCLPR